MVGLFSQSPDLLVLWPAAVCSEMIRLIDRQHWQLMANNVDQQFLI